MKATHKERWMTMTTGKGDTEVLIKPGQFVFGRNKAAKELKAKPISTYKRLLKLKSIGNLNIQSNTHYSIVSIVNWEIYKVPAGLRGQPKEHPGNNQVTTKEQPSNTDNNVNNVKHKKHIFINSPFYSYDSFKEELKGWSEKKIRHYYEAAKDYSKANPSKTYANWVSAIRNWDRREPWKGDAFDV